MSFKDKFIALSKANRHSKTDTKEYIQPEYILRVSQTNYTTGDPTQTCIYLKCLDNSEEGFYLDTVYVTESFEEICSIIDKHNNNVKVDQKITTILKD